MSNPAADFTSSVVIPSLTAPEAREWRAAFSHYQLEEALAQALRPAWSPEAEFFAHRLPLHTDGVAVRLTRLTPPVENVPPHWQCEAEVTGQSPWRDRFTEQFSRLIGALPFRGVVNGVNFRRIESIGDLAYGESNDNGLPKYTACARLRITVNGAGTVFGTPDLPPEEPDWQKALARYRLVCVPELAAGMARFLQEAIQVPDWLPLRTAPLLPGREGVQISVTQAAGFVRPEWRDFVVAVKAHSLRHAEAGLLLGKMQARFPLGPQWLSSPNGSTIKLVAAFAPEALTLTDTWHDGRLFRTGGFQVTVRIATAESSWTDTPPPVVPPVTPPLPDLTALERALNAFAARRLGLTVDRDLWRGGLPPRQSGGATWFRGLAAGQTAYERRLLFQFQLRFHRRDEVQRHLEQLAGCFPAYDPVLEADGVKFPLRALLNPKATISNTADHGREVWLGELELVAVL